MSVGCRIFALVVAVGVPFPAVQWYNNRDLHAQAQADAAHVAALRAGMVSKNLQRVVSGIEQLLVAVAESPPVSKGGSCDAEYISRVRSEFGFLATLGVSNATGEIACVDASMSPVNGYSWERYPFRRAMQAEGVQVGEVVAIAPGKYVLTFACAIRFPATELLRGVVFASLDLDWLANQLTHEPLLSRHSLVVADHRGTVLIDLPYAAHRGDRLPDTWLRRLTGTKPGIIDGNDDVLIGDTPRLVAYVPPAASAHHLLVIAASGGRTTAAIDSAGRRGLLTALAAMAGGLLLAGLLVRYGIKRPLARILAVARRAQAGDTKARTEFADEKSEFGQIGAALNRLAEALGVCERLKATAELKLNEYRDRALRDSALKRELLAETSHDLRQPLQALSMSAEVLAARHRSDGDAPAIDIIRRAIDRLEGVVDSFSDVANVERERMKPRFPSVRVDETLLSFKDEFAAAAARRSISMTVNADVVHARSDPAMLKRTLRDLLARALELTPDGEHVDLACSQEGERVAISVSISADRLGSRGKQDGFEGSPNDGKGERALGLGVTHKLGEVLDHPIAVESRPGGVVVFTVFVTAASDAWPAGSAAPMRNIPVAPNVLLAEDDELVARATSELLLSWGASVKVGKTVHEALRMLDDFAFDAVVSDYRLPDGRGTHVIARARDRWPNIAAALVTAEASADIADWAKANGVEPLRKPIEPLALLNFLLRHLKNPVEQMDR